MRRLFACLLLFVASAPVLAQVAPPTLTARSWLLLDVTSGQVIASHEPDRKADPASLTKLMTAYLAFNALKEIGVRYDQPHPKSTPIPWFMKHVNTSSKQTALQESESTNYVIGVLDGEVDYDQLPTL